MFCERNLIAGTLGNKKDRPSGGPKTTSQTVKFLQKNLGRNSSLSSGRLGWRQWSKDPLWFPRKAPSAEKLPRKVASLGRMTLSVDSEEPPAPEGAADEIKLTQKSD